MHEDPRKAPLPNDPAAHSDAVGRPVDASSRIAFTTSDGQPVEVPLLTLVPIPRLTIDEATVGFDMEVRSDGSTAVNGAAAPRRTIRKNDGNYSGPITAERAVGFDAARGLDPRRHRPQRASPQTPPRKYDSSRYLRRNSAAALSG